MENSKAEEVTQATLPECKRLWDLRLKSNPNTFYDPVSDPKNFIEDLWPLSVTPTDDGWKISPQYGHGMAFTPIEVSERLIVGHINWTLAYRLLGLETRRAVEAETRRCLEVAAKNEAMFLQDLEAERAKAQKLVGTARNVIDGERDHRLHGDSYEKVRVNVLNLSKALAAWKGENV